MRPVHLILLLGAVLAAAPVRAQRHEPVLQSYALPAGISRERVDVLARAVAFSSWPDPEDVFVAPPISRAVLGDVLVPSREVKACTTIRFGQSPWGSCEWSWDGLELALTLAPTARAAQELMLAQMADSNAPAELMAAAFAKAERLAGLGDVSFLVRSRGGEDVRIRFTRGNVAVNVRTTKPGADALGLARRVDALVTGQVPLTARELLDRRPKIALKRPLRPRGAAPFEVTTPAGTEVMQLRAAVDGRPVFARGGEVALGEDARQVEVVAITRELLAADAELTLAR